MDDLEKDEDVKLSEMTEGEFLDNLSDLADEKIERFLFRFFAYQIAFGIIILFILKTIGVF